MESELLAEFRRSITLNLKLAMRMRRIEKRMLALESLPRASSEKIEALEKRVQELMLAARPRRMG